MSLQSISKDIKTKKFASLYVLAGDEPFFIEVLEKQFIDEAIDSADRDFNQHVLFGKDIASDEVVKLAKQFPMMADRQLIIVKEAQGLNNLEVFQKYIQNPLSQTVLVLSFKGKKVDKTLEKHFAGATIFDSKRIYDNQLPAFIAGQVADHGLKIADNAANMLAEYLGNDLSKIVNEINKLAVLLPKGSEIDSKVIADNIGFSREYNVFSLVSALALRNKTQVLKIAHIISKNLKANPLVLVLGQLHTLYSKVLAIQFMNTSNPAELAKALGMSPFYLKDYQTAAVKYTRKELAENIHLLAQYDLKSKGVGNSSADDSQLLMELIHRLLR